MPRFQTENLARNMALLQALEEVAKANGCTPGQIALAWVLAQGDDVVPIPGTKRRTYLEENARAADLHLSASDLARLNQVFRAGAAAGERYPPDGLERVGL